MKKYKQIGWLVTTKHAKAQFISMDWVNPELMPVMERNGCSFKAVYEEEV